MATLANKTRKKVNANTKVSSVKKDTKNVAVKKEQNDYQALQSNIGNQAVKKLFEAGQIQAKLAVSEPSDAFEQEADRVANEVVNMSDTQVQAKQFKQQSKPLNIQRKSTTSNQTQYVSSSVESKINSLQGGGQALSKKTRAFFEPRFGHDFSGVRIHTNRNAQQLANSINARAFTKGNDIVFGSGEYTPESFEGKKLLGHELTHVLQQNSYIYREKKKKKSTTKKEYPLQYIINGYNGLDINLNRIRSQIDTQRLKYNIHIKKINNAFAKANMNYNNEIKKVTQAIALRNSTISAAFSIIAVGAIGNISAVLQETSSVAARINTLEDYIQTATDKGIGFIKPTTPLAKIPSENAVIDANNRGIEVDTMVLPLLQDLLRLRNLLVPAYNDANALFLDEKRTKTTKEDANKTFKHVQKEVKSIISAITAMDFYKKDPEKFDQSQVQIAFEKKLLSDFGRDWLIDKHEKFECDMGVCTQIKGLYTYSWKVDIFAGYGDPFRKYINKLLKDEGINIGSWELTDSGNMQFYKWAKAYKAKKIV